MSDSEGILLAARYGYVTNSLGYCGPKGTGDSLYNFVCTGKGAPQVRKALERFEALYPYLRMISRARGIRDPLDEKVVRAHFTGGKLIEGSWQAELSNLIRGTFSKRGLPRRIAESLASKVPASAVPHHSFHVFFIHTITGSVPATRATENNCIISPARYLGNGFAERRFVEKNGRFGKLRKTNVKIDAEFLGRAPEKGDYLALHWNFAAEILTKRQAKLLEKINRRNLDAVLG
ncbi:MAG: DUF6390 family protein [archaeon]